MHGCEAHCACCMEPILADALTLRHAAGRTRSEVATAVRAGACCGHVFHAACLTRWVLTRLVAGEEPSCPMCRGNLDALLEEHNIVKRSAFTGDTHLNATLVEHAVHFLGFALPIPLCACGMLADSPDVHPFFRLLVLKHAREVTSGWSLHERVRNRFCMQLDVLPGVHGGAAILVRLYHLMGRPMIKFEVAFVTTARHGLERSMMGHVRNVVMHTLMLPETLDNLRAIRLRGEAAVHYRVAVRVATAKEMVAKHAGRYAETILDHLYGQHATKKREEATVSFA